MLSAVRRRISPLRLSALAADFSPSTAAPSADPAVSYLISSCGLSPTAAARAAPSVRLASPRAAAQADAVLALLRRYGFSNTDISSTIRKRLTLLNTAPAKSLQPKLEFLASIGIEAPLLQRLVLLNPQILLRSINGHLEPLFASLREVLGSDAGVVAALNKMPFAIRCDAKSFLLTLPQLRDVHGLSAADVSKLVAARPCVLLLSPDRINEIVEAARKVVVEPGIPMFVHVFRVLSTMKAPTLERKFALYRSLGFHKDAVTQMIRRYPLSFTLSEKKILEIVPFLTDKVGLTRDDIVTCPNGQTCSRRAWRSTLGGALCLLC
jgi:mTERF domain-containing protein, mitochondrial